MTEKIYDYDPAAALESEEAIAVFLADALETGDSAYVAKALGVVARAKGMTELARQTGLSREQLYRSFSERGNPTLKTLLSVTRALGVDLTTRPQRARADGQGSKSQLQGVRDQARGSRVRSKD